MTSIIDPAEANNTHVFSKADPSPTRTTLDLSTYGFKDAAILGRYEYSRAHPPLKEHSHGDMMEISFLERGEQTYLVNDEEFHMRGGDVFVTHPNELHGTGNYPEGKGVMFWLLIRIRPEADTVLDLPKSEGITLLEQLQCLPRIFRGERNIKDTLYRIFDVHGRNAGGLQVLNVRNLLIRFLLDIAHSARATAPQGISPEILEIMQHVKKNVTKNFLLEELASRVGLSVSRFKARFKDEVGIPPADYVSRQKVNEAMDMLQKTGMPITHVATRLGYSSSQYFATAFRRYTGKTPSQARREAYIT